MATPDFTGLERQYNLPPGFLAAQQQVESGGNPNAVSPSGAIGVAQFMPATAKAMGVDPRDPIAATQAQAKLMRQNLDATGGDIDLAARMYHGGPDQSKWGSKNAAYPGQILAALQAGQTAPSAPAEATDPIEAALSKQAGISAPQPQQNAPTSSDPIEAALQARIGGGGDSTGNHSVGLPSVVPPDGGHGSVQDANGGNQAGTPPQAGTSDNPVTSVAHGLNDALWGAGSGVSTIGGSLEKAGAWALDKTGLTGNASAAADKDNAAEQAYYRSHEYNPNGWAAGLGRFSGQVVGTAPVAELNILKAAPGASAITRGMFGLGNYAAQGAAAGAMTSDGNDVGRNIATGALLAPIAGTVLEKAAIPLAAKLMRGSADATSSIANGLKNWRASSPGADVGAEVGAEGNPAWMGHGTVTKAADGTESIQYAPDTGEGLTGSVTDDRTTSAQIAAGLKAAGARSGIEATPTLPAAAQADFSRLVASGVPEDHALNEAAVRYVGGEPTVGNVTRDRGAQEAEFEGAKLTTPDGQALANRIASNNAAIHGAAQQTVEGYGGVPAQGQATEDAAVSLAKSSDAAKAQTTAAYNTARAQDGDQRVSIDGVRELLAKPKYQAPTTTEGKQLVSGLQGQIDAMGTANGGRFSPDEIDALHQAANDAYNPMGGGANGMVGEVKGALGESLDQFDKAGDAFKSARALHRQWAQQYDDPAGIQKLIQRDAQGNFVQNDNWRAAGNSLIGTTSDRAFTQVVRQLQATGDTGAIDGLKGEIVQRAYEASKGAADHLGNPTFMAKNWEAALNKIGMPKLQAIFSPEEVSHLATIGRAARAVNEPVPGTVNMSNTASKLSNLADSIAAANAAKGSHGMPPMIKAAAHVIVGHATGGAGNIALEGINAGLGKRGASAANAQLADAIKMTLDPAAARAAANENTATMATQAERTAATKSLARTLAAPSTSYRKGAN